MACVVKLKHCQPWDKCGNPRQQPACIESVCVAGASEVRVKVKPGGYHVGYGEVRIETVLGSCVAVCARDPVAGIGGVNHFLLPRPVSTGNQVSPRYGEQAMAQLIDAILARGGKRERLELKLFGGAHVLRDAQYDVGQHNIDFIRDFVSREALMVISEDLGGKASRRLIYDVRSGSVKLRCSPVYADAELGDHERHLLTSINRNQPEGWGG